MSKMKDSQVNAEVPPEAAADSAIQLNPGAERTTNLGGKQFHCTTLEIGDQSFRAAEKGCEYLHDVFNIWHDTYPINQRHAY